MVPSTTSRSVSVSWNAIDCIERNGVITGYKIEFQEQGGARILGEVVNEMFSIHGLIPHTNYTFRVAGVNSNGTGPYSDITNILTNEYGSWLCLDLQLHVNVTIFAAPGVISNLMVEPRFTSIVFTWRPPQYPNGVIIAYEVTYSINGSIPTAMNITEMNTALTTELVPNTRVSAISVRAYTSIGPGNARMHHDVFIPQQPTPRESS